MQSTIKRFCNSVGMWYQSSRGIYTPAHLEGYQIVFLNICEHASIASCFASTSSVQIIFCLASSEHLIRKHSWWAVSTWFSASRNPFSSNFTRWLISTETLRSFHALTLDNFTKIHLMLYFPANILWLHAHTLNTNEARFQKNFNEIPSIRAIAKVFWAWASKHLSKFCGQTEQGPNFLNTWKFFGRFDTPTLHNLQLNQHQQHPIQVQEIPETEVFFPSGATNG